MLDFFKNIEILSKTVVATFWATFGNDGATFISKSGHTCFGQAWRTN